MNYVFKDVDRSLGVAIYAHNHPALGINLVRKKTEGVTQEMLIDKKANAKVAGFANVINYLADYSMFSQEADFVNWLCNHCHLKCPLSRAVAFAEREKHAVLEAILFAEFHRLRVELDDEQKAWFDAYGAKNAAAIEKYRKANETPSPDAKAKQAPQAAKAAQPKAQGGAEQPKKKEKVKEEIPQEYKNLVFSQKITRCDKGQVVLPQEGQPNILVTSALPYVNNVPHLGNLIGAVLSADVFARYSRLKGNNTIYICGTDMYGTATEFKAISEGKAPREVVDHFHKMHEEIYSDFEIDFDHFCGTATPNHDKIVQDIFLKDLENGFFYKEASEEYFSKKYNIGLADRFIKGTCPHCQYDDAKGDQCDKCGSLLDPDDLIDPKCTLSNETPERRRTEHYYLDLKKLESQIVDFIDTSSKEGNWSSNSISISKGWIKSGLRPRCMTRDLNWGVKVPVEGADNKVFYVWFDAPIGYISITANYTDQWQKWWKNPENVKLFQFMGKDNVPFHTVLFPGSLIGTKENWTMLHHISTTEYLNYETGKFSKSSNRGVFGDNVKDMPYIRSCWRYYLLANRPEAADSLFQWHDFKAKVNEELLPNPGNLCNRVLKFVYTNYQKQVPSAKPEELSA